LLFDDADRGANATLTVDLEKQQITGPDGGLLNFEMDPFRKQCLLEGLDDIGQTMRRTDRIDGFEERQKTGQPWLYSGAAE
jgi:3-isopropylmalate/(R)-2-methylmalate dehydratase small subunit